MTLRYHKYEVAIDDWNTEIVYVLAKNGDKAYKGVWNLIYNYFHTYPEAIIFNFITEFEASKVGDKNDQED